MRIATVKEMPAEERPREKALKYGIRQCSNREVLALILRSGVAGASSLMIADEILMKASGLKGLSGMDLHELTAIKGISLVRGLEIEACFELARRMSMERVEQQDIIDHPQLLIDWLQKEIGADRQENFLAVYLDTRNHILRHKILFKGTLDASIVHPREVFKEAVLVSASRILVVHNHPSQDLTPSRADKAITLRLKETGKMMGIELLDHLIVSTSGYFSFRAHGLMD